MPSSDIDYLKGLIRTVPDWPEPGVAFRDIMPLLRTPRALRLLVDLFVHRYIEADLDLVAGIDARGFIIGSIVAYELGLGFVPIRKAGKLPGKTVSETYQLEYGDSSCVEMQADACRPGDRLLLFDDLIATGGTLLAACRLIERIGGVVVEAAAIIDLPELGGSRRIAKAGPPLHWLLSFGPQQPPQSPER